MQLLIVILCVASAIAFPKSNIGREAWELYKTQYNKQYVSPEEEETRREIWRENLVYIQKHNEETLLGKHSYILNTNEFADLTNEEFRTLLGLKSLHKLFQKHPINIPEELPAEVDWRKKGIVTPVKDQGAMGYDWAFSTAGTLESQHAKTTGNLISLSEQNLGDCCDSFNVYQCIKDMGGVDTEDGYPDLQVNGTCRFNPKAVGATLKSWKYLPQGDEASLQAAVANVGPISVDVDASHMSFQLYSGGVYDEPECSDVDLDHAVLIVGYGVTEDNVDYWTVKNSWGVSWGEKGYIKMSRNKNNQCGIATAGSYPIV